MASNYKNKHTVRSLQSILWFKKVRWHAEISTIFKELEIFQPCASSIFLGLRFLMNQHDPRS